MRRIGRQDARQALRICFSAETAAFGLRRLELKFLEVEPGSALGEVQNLHTDYLILLVEVEPDSRCHLFGLDHPGIVQPEAQGVSLGIHFQPHNLPFLLRSNYTLGRASLLRRTP